MLGTIESRQVLIPWRVLIIIMHCSKVHIWPLSKSPQIPNPFFLACLKMQIAMSIHLTCGTEDNIWIRLNFWKSIICFLTGQLKIWLPFIKLWLIMLVSILLPCAVPRQRWDWALWANLWCFVDMGSIVGICGNYRETAESHKNKK